MNYRKKFEMSDYSYNAFSDVLHETLEDGEKLNLTTLDNCAELLLQAELMVMQPVKHEKPEYGKSMYDDFEKYADCEIPEKAEDFKRQLVNNYNYLTGNIGNDFKVLSIDHPMMSFLVMYLTKTFNKYEEVR